MMFKSIIYLILSLTATYAGYAGSYAGNNVGGGGASGGYGYGYGGNVPPGFPSQFFQQIPFDFSNLLAGYMGDLIEHHQTLIDNKKVYAYTSVSLNPPFKGTVMARSRITFDGIHQLQNTIQKQAAASANYAPTGSAFGSYAPNDNAPDISLRSGASPSYSSYGGGFGSSYGSGYGGSFSSASGIPGGYGAGASASIGNDGVQQTAFLNPENPASPNVNVRFGGASDFGGDGKTYGVFTSSSSGSGNIDGKPYGFRRASTTINDNGKVRTYTVTD